MISNSLCSFRHQRGHLSLEIMMMRRIMVMIQPAQVLSLYLTYSVLPDLRGDQPYYFVLFLQLVNEHKLCSMLPNGLQWWCFLMASKQFCPSPFLTSISPPSLKDNALWSSEVSNIQEIVPKPSMDIDISHGHSMSQEESPQTWASCRIITLPFLFPHLLYLRIRTSIILLKPHKNFTRKISPFLEDTELREVKSFAQSYKTFPKWLI